MQTLRVGNIAIERATPETPLENLYRAAVTALGSHDEKDTWHPPDVETFRDWALQEVERRREEELAKYAKPVYYKKEQMAREVLRQPTSPYLAAEAEARKISPVELAQVIVQKAEEASVCIDRIEAWAVKTGEAISVAKDIDTIIKILVGDEKEVLDETPRIGGV